MARSLEDPAAQYQVGLTPDFVVETVGILSTVRRLMIVAALEENTKYGDALNTLYSTLVDDYIQQHRCSVFSGTRTNQSLAKKRTEEEQQGSERERTLKKNKKNKEEKNE